MSKDLRTQEPLRGHGGKKNDKLTPMQHNALTSVNRVPEPFARALHPHQRTPPVVAATKFKTAYSAFEQQGMLAHRPRPKRSIDVQDLDDDELRAHCAAVDMPVSGTRAQLLKHLVDVTPVHEMSLKKLRETCVKSGVSTLTDKHTMIETLQEHRKIMVDLAFKTLTLEDLRFECLYRNLPTQGTREQLMDRLLTRTGRGHKWGMGW